MNWHLLSLRLVSVAVVQTYFVPDEYWQSMEVAHRMVFGYGYRTWEWRECIRSYAMPFVIALLYKCLHVLSLDYRLILVYAPRVFMALLTWLSDEAILSTARRLYGSPASSGAWRATQGCQSAKPTRPTRPPDSDPAAAVAFCLATNWCLFYCGSRTLVNTVEMALLSLALPLYPWQRHLCETVDLRYLAFGVLACAVRPTAAIFFLPLWMAHMWRATNCRFRLLLKTLTMGCGALCLCVALDSWLSGSLCVSSYNFCRLNLFDGVAQYYGTSPWHAHLTTSLPLLFGPLLLLLPGGVRRGAGGKLVTSVLFRWPGGLVLLVLVASVAVLSLISHKEFRFLLAVVPMGSLLFGKLLHDIRHCRKWCRLVRFAVIMYNLPVALYLSLSHQRGPLSIMESVHQHTIVSASHDRWQHVLFLTPCHSTPLYSHLHVNVSIRFLTCEPNWNNEADYQDEYDMFEANPIGWLRSEYSNLFAPPTGNTSQFVSDRSQSPSQIVAFDWLWWDVLRSVIGWRYHVCADWLNTHFTYDRRRSSRILLLCSN